MELDPSADFDYMSALPNASGVITTGTFSKTVAPGLRLGWVFAPPPIIRLCNMLCQAAKPNGRSTVLCAGLGDCELPLPAALRSALGGSRPA